MTRRPTNSPLPAARAALGVLAAGCLAAQPASADGGRPAAPLSIKLLGLRSNGGRAGCTLYDGPQGFPVDAGRALQQRWCAVESRASTCRFDPIPEGTYAVACFHDENGNGKLDRNWLGIPTEGTVASNHAKGTLGPPRYDDAKFAFNGQPAELALRMAY
jgi:uncharacterized protein (DUF2141 family)